MARYKILIKNNLVSVTTKQLHAFEINRREIEIFAGNPMHQFFRPQIEKENKIVYLAPMGVPLYKYLRQCMNTQTFYNLLNQILNVIKKIEELGLNIDNLVLNKKLVMVKENGDLVFLYEPIIGKKDNFNPSAFLKDILSCIPANNYELLVECSKIKNFLAQSGNCSLSDIENFLKPNKRTASQIQLPIQESREEQRTVLLHNEEEGTILLSEEGETTLLQQETEISILRRNTKEKKVFTNGKICLGKDCSVEYCVNGNNTISRRHALIHKNGSEFEIEDLHSKNGTYVNNIRLVEGERKALEDGDVIRLSDEEFEIHII